jgi:hypothetical protein
MKLNEIAQRVNKKGTYAGVYFSKSSVNKIEQFCKEFGVNNALNPDKLHITLLYSRKFLPDYKALGKLETPIVAQPKQFVIWESHDEPPTNCLVLKLDCPELVDRHKFLMKEHGAIYDHKRYNPHISLSYDIGDDFDLAEANKNLSKLSDIELTVEYQEVLKLDWAKTA